MKAHLYRITVEHVQDSAGNMVGAEPVQFTARNHDDLFMIIDRLNERQLFESNENAAFGIGLKLFSEVMLRHRDHTLFQSLRPHFGDFMKQLKNS